MKISLYDRPPVLDTEGAFDDSDLLQRFEQRAMEFNRPGGFVDALRKGTAGLLRSFVAPNNIEADSLTALIGNEQERLNDPIGREMSQAQWDAYMRENAQSAANPNFFGLRSLADYIEPTPHAEPDNLLGKAAYKAGEYIPGIAGSVAEFMTLGPWGTILLNTVLGGQASQQQVYENQLAQGKSTQEARDIAEGFLGNAADFAVRGGTNLATLWALGRAYPGFQSGISPVGHTLRNIGLASGISGAGAMGEEAITNYRSDKDNNLGNLAETGATSAATTGIIGLTLAGLRAKKLIEAQREYNAYQGLHNVEWRDITPPDAPDEPLGLGGSNNPQPPNNSPQSPNGTLALPQGTLQLPEFTTRNIAARLNKAVTQRGFNPITNDFQPNALARQIAAHVGNGFMSMDDALSMLQEGGLSPDDAKGFLDTGIAEILERTRVPETPKQPTEITLDRIANHPDTQSYRRFYEDYANLDETYSDFGGDNSTPLQDFPDTFTYSPNPENNPPRLTALNNTQSPAQPKKNTPNWRYQGSIGNMPGYKDLQLDDNDRLLGNQDGTFRNGTLTVPDAEGNPTNVYVRYKASDSNPYVTFSLVPHNTNNANEADIDVAWYDIRRNKFGALARGENDSLVDPIIEQFRQHVGDFFTPNKPEQPQQTPTLTALGSEAQSQEQNNPLSFEEFKAAQANQNYGYQSILRNIAGNNNKPNASHVNPELQKPNVVRGLDGLEDILQPPQRLTALSGQPQDTQQKPNADITFDEALRNVAEIIYQQHSQKPGKAYSVKPVWDFSNNLPEPVKTQVGEYLHNHRIMVNNSSSVDGYPQYFIGDLQALKDILQNFQHETNKNYPADLPAKIVQEKFFYNIEKLLSELNPAQLKDLANSEHINIDNSSDDLLSSNIASVIQNRLRLLRNGENIQGISDTPIVRAFREAAQQKTALPEPQAPTLTALNDTQQPKPESGGIAENLKNIVESSPTQQPQPELKPFSFKFSQMEGTFSVSQDVYDGKLNVHYSDSNYSGRVARFHNGKLDEIRKMKKGLHEALVKKISAHINRLTHGVIPADAKLHNGEIDMSGENIDMGHGHFRNFYPHETPFRVRANNSGGTLSFFMGSGKKTFAVYDANTDSFRLADDGSSDYRYIAAALEKKFREQISNFYSLKGSGTKKTDSTTEQAATPKNDTPTREPAATQIIPPDAYLKKGILFFSYYPEGSKRKQDVRFTSEIIATGNGHKSIHLKNKTFGEYVYDADTREISYRGNNPDGEKMLPTVKKEFLRQIKDFYVDRDKNSNGLPVLEKGDIAIQGSNSRLQTQDAIILRPRNLNHNDGKFEVIAVSNNGDFAGTLAHHGTFEGHSYIPPKNSHFSKEYVDQLEQLIRSELRKKFSIIPERAVIKNKNGYIDISDMAPPYGSEVRITRDNSKFTVKPHPKSRFFTFHMQNSKKKKPYAYYYPDTDSFMLEEDERDRGLIHMLEKRFREKIKDFYYGGDEDTQQPQQDSKSVTPQAETTAPQITRLANRVKSRILEALDEDKDITPFSNDDLREWATQEFGGTLGQGAYTQKQAYDAMEMGINLAIAESGITPATAEDTHDAVNDIQRLLRILQVIPTQTNRDKEQVAFQQFSTPPTLAYLVNWLANIGKNNIALEPSAGTGNLAVFAHNAGAKLILNDYSTSGLRADILDALGWGKVYRKDALDIADILLPKLSEDERPDRVIMNPPFSAAGKQGTANSNQNGFQHVEQALQLLKENGRLVAILGAGRDGTASSVKKWLKHIGKKYNVRALITVDGKAYQRYGTIFDNAIVVIDKTGETPKNSTLDYSISGDFNSFVNVKAIFDSLAYIHNDIDESSNFLKWDEAVTDRENKKQSILDSLQPEPEHEGSSINQSVSNIILNLAQGKNDNDFIPVEDIVNEARSSGINDKDIFSSINALQDNGAIRVFFKPNITEEDDLDSYKSNVIKIYDKNKLMNESSNTSQDYSVEAFKKAFDDCDHGRIFVRICDIRRKLGWPREVFDGMIRDLRNRRVIQLHTIDASLMTEDEVADSFIDENNFRKGSVTWHGYNSNDDDEPDNDSTPPKPEPPKPAPAPKNDTPKAEAKNETTAPEKSDIPDTIRNNPALKAIHDYLDGNTDLTLKIDEAIRASMEANFRYNLQKERQIQEAISLALGSAGFEMLENTRMTMHIYELVRNNQGYDDEHHIIATENPKKEWEGFAHDRLKQEEATAKTAELVEKVKAAKNEQEIKAILGSVNLHSITGILEGIVGRLYRQASGITSKMNRQQVVERALNTIMDRLHGKPSSEYLLNHLEELSFFSLKEYAKDLGIDIDSLIGTRDDSEPNRAKLRIAIKKALKADTTPETTESNPVQEQENPEPVTESKPQKYVSRKKSEQPDDNDSSEDEAPSIYSDYEPQEHSGIHLFDIAKQHPSQLVETTNMKAVHLPPLTYSPHLPDKMIQSGAISEAQLEAVAYAGQAFTQKLPSGQTKGFILGDGTGSGKGRTIAAIITDQLNQNHGNGKAVWFSVSADLFKDAQRDLDGIGEDKKQLFELGETKLGDTIPTAKKGIMFTTYNTLIRTGKKKTDDYNTDNDSESDKSAEGAIDTKRIKQIVDWLGEDFDGVIAFDECHKINNLGGENSGFGISSPSQSADAARKLADALPHARILYVSATSATDPNNLRMFDRSGLWGENTPFANADTFAAEIKAGGPNAMEMFARDAKSLGVFVARSLSPKGLTYRRLNYKLSKTERDMYNEVAQAWRTVDDAVTRGFQAVGGDPKSGKNDKGFNAKFRGRQLQCFNFLLTAFKTNALIEDAKKQLDDGKSVVIQLDSTYDAFIDRILKGKQKGDDLRDVIISPVEDLIGFVMDYFPIHKMRQVSVERPNGDNYITNETVIDEETGKPVVSQAALNIRNTLIAHLKRVRFNMSPLDRIINSLGGLANVAEVTRRKHRLIEQADGKIIDAKQPPSANKEVDAFNNGEKRVIIFSRAGNTGRSFHADKSFKNSQRRIHYLLEGGFSAFNAIQGFGRTHRSNESSQPEYVVVAADIPGEIRFISAIVRKLGQMGALTAGDRKNNTQGLYSEKDNMESRLAAIAMNHVMGNLLSGAYPEFPDGDEVIRQMGFDPDTFGMKDIPLKRIFNRILSLDLEIQDVLISYFNMEHEQLLLMAIQNGTADIGTENIRALDCETIQDKTILEDKAKGIKTKYLELKVKVKSRIRPFQNVSRVQHCEEFFIDQDGTIYAAKKNGQYETDEEGNQHFRPSFDMKDGEPIQRYTLFTTDMNTTYATDALALQNKKHNQKRLFTPVSREKAKELWQSQSSSMENSHFETIHMISGVLLPIWNHLKQLKSSRVKRVILPDDTSIIGRILEESEVKSIQRFFGINYEGKTYTVQDVLRELDKPKTFARLSNNWKLKYSRVSGEKRIEILYNDYHDEPMLQKLGALIEIIGSDTRAFVPVGNNDVLHAVITYSEVTGFENDASADDILDEAAQKINSNIPDSAKLYFIHPSFRAFFNDPDDNPHVHSSNYPLDSDEREYRYKAAKNADSSKSVWQHIKEFGSKVWKGRHDIPELADEKGRIDDSLVKAQELLRGLKRERQANVHEAEKRLRAALLGLSPDDFDLFQRAMELRDLYETRKADPNASMPWGLNPNLSELLSNRDPVKENYETIMGHVRKNPRVQKAMKDADKLIEDLRDKLIEAAERLGMFDVRDRLRRKHYFRHLVLEYYNMQRSGKPHPTFKNPERRGYMKHREGSNKDISSNWLLAMGEVFTRMTDDIKILDTLFKLRNEYDIIETLKQEAFQTNMNNALTEIMKGLKDVPDELRKSIAEEQLQTILQARQARAMSELFKLAQNGDLPIGNNNEWQELAGRMADAGQLEKLSREEQQKLSRYIGWLSTLDDKTKARSAARSFLSGSRSKNAVLKKITGNNFVDWKDLIPDDYTLWSPSDSRLVFSASTTPEYMLKIAMDNIDELLGVNLSDLGKAIATGGNKQLWCIPTRLADALDNIGKSQPVGAFGQIMTKIMGAFKQWVTISPVNGRLFKYNWRNFFGDLEAVLQGNPGALYYFKQAAKELTDVMLRGGVATGSLEEFQKRGGGLTTETMTELERPDRIKEFSHLFEQKKSSNPLKWGVKALREYLYIATTLTNFRESILRYASFLSYIQLIKDNNGVPPFYGMSKPREVKAVGDDIYDIAFKLANENLGAYDQISSNLQWLRDNNFASFLSWVEVNTKRYFRLMANVWQGNSYLEWWIKRKGQKFIDGLIGGGNGNGGNNEPPKNNNGGNFADDDGDNEFRKIFRRVAKKSGVGALRLAITLALAAPLWGLLYLWNMLNGENDEKLPPDVRNKPHLTLNTNPFTGEVLYLGDIGSAFDALNMFGVGNLITGDLRDLFDGRTSFGQLVTNILDGPVSKIVSNANPFAKAIVEAALGKRTFPSALHPTPIRDKGRFVAQSFGLEWYYDFLTDKPHKPFYDFSSSVVNSSNQDSSAYFYMLSRRKQFEENVLGKSVDAFTMTRRGEALRNAKRAADLGDRKSLRKYLREYFRAGGSEQGLKISARTMEPLYGLNDTDEMRFIAWLPKEERKILRRAMRYAERMKAKLGVW